MRQVFVAVWIGLCVSQHASAKDWPMAGFDANRTSYTAESLPNDLKVRWILQSRHAPRPAWPRSQRMMYDRAYSPVVAGGMVFFGNSVDEKVYALDAKTGIERWSFITDGPVRFAPVAWKDRLFVAGDDGFLYCLSIRDGSVLWKKRGGPDHRTILGNGRMVSHWPARGGPAIRDGIVYFGAGIWPTDGIYLYALDAMTGEVRWVNDKSGSIVMNQPHGGARANSGVSAQGNIVVTDDQLFVPTGRAIPAAFRRADGVFEYFHLQKNGHIGGSAAAAFDGVMYNGGLAFDARTGDALTKIGSSVVARLPGGFTAATGSRVAAYRWVKTNKPDRKGKTINVTIAENLWSADKVHAGVALIVAGNTVVSGGEGGVSLIDAKNGSVRSELKVGGSPYGLAAADGCLYASTDQGMIYCFDRSGAKNPKPIAQPVAASPYADNTIYAQVAQEILEKSKVGEGYCLDLGCGDGALAYELAKRSNLRICAVDADPAMVTLARKRLDAAGLYGSRITVHHRDDLSKNGYPKFFSNLIVSGRSVTAGAEGLPRSEVRRMLRPYGGVVCLGKPGALDLRVRGALDGAGQWTHQYANAGNTLCSTDTLVKGPLRILWFTDVDVEMPQRHGRGPAPLFHHGRLIVEGMHEIRAVDAYNGRSLWSYPLKNILTAYSADHLMGASGTGSNFCVSDDSVYARVADLCLRIDLATGKKLATLRAPKQPDGKTGTWGFLAQEDGLVFGSLANTEHVVTHAWRPADMSTLFTESLLFFALDAKTGDLLWKYKPKDSIRHNAIALGDGRVFLIDRPLAQVDLLEQSKAKRRGAKSKGAAQKTDHATGTMVSLDARTGNVLWKSDEDIWGTTLAFSEPHDAVMMGYQPTRFKLPSEVGGKIAVFHASAGYRLWEKRAKYVTRPLINDTTIYAQGGAWDLLSGEERPFDFSRSYGCGQLSGSKHLMLFRSATLGYYDLSSERTTHNVGGIRPGCWINALPVGGLVLVPDASAGCKCSYLNQAWIALEGSE